MSRIVHTEIELSQYLGVSKDLIPGMIKAGMPMLDDGSFDLEDIKKWRDGRLGLPVPMEDYTKELDKFKVNRAEIYALEQKELIKLQQVIRRTHFNRDTIKDLSPGLAKDLYTELRLDQRTKFDQERLERGESTENVAVLVKAIKEEKKRGKVESG